MSFAGRGVLVTRPADLAVGLASLIQASGGRAIVFPTIEIEDLPRPAALDRLGEFQLAIFISPSAVARALRASSSWPSGLRVAAAGEGTRRALERRGISGVIAPRAGADSEALLALPELASFSGERVVIFRGEGGRKLLGDTLAERGARVEYAECYRRTRPDSDPAPLLGAWAKGDIDAVTVFSREALDNLVAMLGPAGEARLQSAPLFVSHPRIAQHAARRGIRQAIVAGPGDDDMIRRLVAYFDEPD